MFCYEIVTNIKRLNIFSALCYLSLLFFPTSCPSAGSLRSAVTIDIYVNAVLQYVPFCLFFTQCNYFEIHLCFHASVIHSFSLKSVFPFYVCIVVAMLFSC